LPAAERESAAAIATERKKKVPGPFGLGDIHAALLAAEEDAEV
jgi:hypothetical protein